MLEMLELAVKVSENAYAPYSGFKVGAVVKSADGELYAGCNVENASYGLTICAERAAIFNAVAAGREQLDELLVYADTDFVAPCGACRQVMQEFGVKKVHLAGAGQEIKTFTLEQLLPLAFSDKDFI